MMMKILMQPEEPCVLEMKKLDIGKIETAYHEG